MTEVKVLQMTRAMHLRPYDLPPDIFAGIRSNEECCIAKNRSSKITGEDDWVHKAIYPPPARENMAQ